MTQTAPRIAALALSALMTLAIVAGVNGIANKEYAAADTLAMAPYGQTHAVLQRVTVLGRRANA